MATEADQIQNEMIELGVYALVVRGQGKDLLMGKNIKDYVPVPGLEALLHLFILDIDGAFSFIYKQDVEGYLKVLQKKFQLDFPSLQENLLANISGMIEMESDDVMIYYLVITKTLEFIRQEVYDRNCWEIVSLAYKHLQKKSPEENLKKKMQELDDQGNPAMSLMYNLIFIYFLANKYKPEVKSTIIEIVAKIIAQIL
jgi:hypothetical protein